MGVGEGGGREEREGEEGRGEERRKGRVKQCNTRTNCCIKGSKNVFHKNKK